MDILDIILLVLFVASVTFNICFVFTFYKLRCELSKDRRKHLKYKTELGCIPRDYDDNEQGYFGCDM